MPVSHDLYQDLSWTKEEVQKKRADNPRLDSLLNQYSQADADVVKAENATSDAPGDDEVRKLKEKRLEIKDQIVEQLEAKAR